jgi:hypothetical protein
MLSVIMLIVCYLSVIMLIVMLTLCHYADCYAEYCYAYCCNVERSYADCYANCVSLCWLLWLSAYVDVFIKNRYSAFFSRSFSVFFQAPTTPSSPSGSAKRSTRPPSRRKWPTVSSGASSANCKHCFPIPGPGNTKGGKYHCTIDVLFDRFGISCRTTDNFCFYYQNRIIQTSQTGGQRYRDTFPFSITWPGYQNLRARAECCKTFYNCNLQMFLISCSIFSNFSSLV